MTAEAALPPGGGWPGRGRAGAWSALHAHCAALGPLGWIGAAISLAVLGVIARELGRLDLGAIVRSIPWTPAFWLLFAASYLAAPVADWAIFHRLWRLPLSGLAALLRKNIANNLLVGYVGELYLYTWARRRLGFASSPFGAVKDVAILSALAGNIASVLMLGVAYPLLSALHPELGGHAVLLSLVVVIGSSGAIIALGRRIFSLDRSDRRFVLRVHLGRIAVSALLGAFVWNAALPGRPLAFWLLLSSLRLFVGRLPFLPNRDLVLAGMAAFLFGDELEIAAILTAVAALAFLTHLVLGAALAGFDLLSWRRR